MNRLLIQGGRVVDPRNGVDQVRDLLVVGEKVAAVGHNIEPPPDAEILDAAGRVVIPGLVDSHVHISSRPEGYAMLAKAGVTTCLDMSGDPARMREELQAANTGLTAGFLYPITPGGSASGPDPSAEELREIVGKAIEEGAFGVKILGGHVPLTPDATRRAIRAAADAGAYCAVHAGTTQNGSDIKGLEELLALADGAPLHVAHVNSYCRGQVTGDAVQEASLAVNMLRKARNVKSESYLGLINGTSASIVDGAPKSNVTKTCLARRGYALDRAGMEAAIRDGWARVHGVAGEERVLLSPEDGLAAFREGDTNVGVSFKVNSPAAAIALAAAQDGDGRFVVDAISTDGGGIPRNTTLKQGMGLVQYGALTLGELVLKAASKPALMLGLSRKGHLGVGADADIVIFDEPAPAPETVIARGVPILRDGALLRRKPCEAFPCS